MGKWMGSRVRILTSVAVSKLTKPGLHFVGMVPGLAVAISESGSKRWILRFYMNGRRRDMGLGSFPEVTLADAREVAFQKRTLIRQGVDPIEQRRAALDRTKEQNESNLSFRACAAEYIESHSKGWKNVKHSQQWESTLTKYAYPFIGDMKARAITLRDTLKILEPIWETKTETASRLRGRIEAILDWATVRGYRDGLNPARWKGNLETLMPARSKVAKVRHFSALPWEQCPALYSGLKGRKGASIDALQFCILTACRSGEVRGARWSELDLEKAVWTIPAERMKAGREQRVPLSEPALKLLSRLPRFIGDDLVFPNSRGAALSDMAILAALKETSSGVTVHGFRSSFRDWAGESTAYPREVIEHALAHQIKDKAEAAYARGDLFTKRVALMKSWGDFLESRSP
jgi:integrase